MRASLGGGPRSPGCQTDVVDVDVVVVERARNDSTFDGDTMAADVAAFVFAVRRDDTTASLRRKLDDDDDDATLPRNVAVVRC